MQRALLFATALVLLVLLGALTRLARLEQQGPSHVDLDLPGGIPARLYVPGEDPATWGLPEPRPPGERPPAVVLCHGFSGDRAIMSTLARRLAANGYAVLAIEARGHGANRNPFAGGRPDHLAEEFGTAVSFLRASPHVDGDRLAVMGHSMGAAAALDYATRNAGLEAAVMIAGGFVREGPLRPPNALFIYAERDPQWLREASDRLAEGLRAELGGAAGDDFTRGTAVRVISVPGHDHVTILWSSEAAREIVGWLDASFGIERSGPADVTDARLGALGVAFFAFVLLLPALGWAIGRLAPRGTSGSPDRAAWRLGALALALVGTLPFSSSHVVPAVLSQPVAQELASFYLMAGVALLGGMALLGRLDLAPLVARWRASLLAAALGGVVIAAVLTPLGVVLHRLTLTPERALVAVLTGLAMLPFFIAVELLLRRGSTLAATLVSVAGRVLILLAIMLGIATGLLPGFLAFLVPVGAIVFVLAELLAFAIYAVSRNRVVIALLQAGWLAWLQSAGMAIHF